MVDGSKMQCLASLLQNIFKKTPSAILTKELPEIMRILTKVTDVSQSALSVVKQIIIFIDDDPRFPYLTTGKANVADQ
ncbi:hypothetical protein HUJ04_003574 [Dendroctonus ponderosae]|nr:hypothetical protein HUJ04_003574 [Dendroctonus ponderosae]